MIRKYNNIIFSLHIFYKLKNLILSVVLFDAFYHCFFLEQNQVKQNLTVDCINQVYYSESDVLYSF